MRKLAIAALSFSAAIFAANYIFSRDTALYAALICALAGAAVLGVRLKSLKGIVISFFAAAIGFAVFALHYDLTVSRAHDLAGRERVCTFSLLESPQKHEGYTSVDARLQIEGYPDLKCRLFTSGDELDLLNGGDRIETEIKLSAADIRYGVHTNRYNTKDIYLTGTVNHEIIRKGRSISFASLSSTAAEMIAKRMDEVFDQTAAPFIKALIIGEKSDLYDDDALYVLLSRAGLMHVAAVSGMHVSFLIAFLRFLFGKGKRSALVCILLAWAFVAVSGMTPSAVRAAFMQTMLLLAPLFNRENDPITSLSAALAMLLLINPFAAVNISLQLSFTAMLGIVLFFERIQETLMRPLGGRESRAYVESSRWHHLLHLERDDLFAADHGALFWVCIRALAADKSALSLGSADLLYWLLCRRIVRLGPVFGKSARSDRDGPRPISCDPLPFYRRSGLFCHLSAKVDHCSVVDRLFPYPCGGFPVQAQAEI